MVDEPSALWLVRHGQSLGNVVRDTTDPTAEVLDIADRDMDVPLSPLGEEQSLAFGRWLRDRPSRERPDVVLSSPYHRAAQTARLIVDSAQLVTRVHLDERLREREYGVADLLTTRGFASRMPAEAVRRRRLGKFYYRPPGGESWVDVALRLRSLRDSLGREHAGRRVLLVAHEVPILIMRYLLEDLDEASVLALGGGKLANCSLTAYETDADGAPQLVTLGWTAPLELADTEVTEAADAPVAPR